MAKDIFGRPIRLRKQRSKYSVTNLTAADVRALAADGDALNLNHSHQVSETTRFILLQVCDLVGTEEFRKELGFQHDKALTANG